jgi:hypothetical protein
VRQLKGYVATLDVLGFSDLLYRDGYSQQLKNYMTCVNDVIRPTTKTECVVFSDTIVLTSPGSDDDALQALIEACSAAFYALLKNDIPIRGAVAFGSYWREAKAGSVFLAGRPIVEAYRCESSSQWVGILLCSSVLHQRADWKELTMLPEFDPKDPYTSDEIESMIGKLALRLQPATAPFRDSETHTVEDLSGYALIPLEASDGITTAWRRVVVARAALERLRLRAPQPRAQAKYRASLRWLKEMQDSLLNLSRAYRRATKED